MQPLKIFKRQDIDPAVLCLLQNTAQDLPQCFAKLQNLPDDSGIDEDGAVICSDDCGQNLTNIFRDCKASDTLLRAIAGLCAKNEDGEFCYNDAGSVQRSPPDDACFFSDTCTSTCQAQVSQAANTLGCCLDDFLLNVGIDDPDTESAIRNMLMRCDTDVPEVCSASRTIFGLAITSALVLITLLS